MLKMDSGRDQNRVSLHHLTSSGVSRSLAYSSAGMHDSTWRGRLWRSGRREITCTPDLQSDTDIGESTVLESLFKLTFYSMCRLVVTTGAMFVRKSLGSELLTKR